MFILLLLVFKQLHFYFKNILVFVWDVLIKLYICKRNLK